MNQHIELDDSPVFYEWWIALPHSGLGWTDQHYAYEAWRERGRRDKDEVGRLLAALNQIAEHDWAHADDSVDMRRIAMAALAPAKEIPNDSEINELRRKVIDSLHATHSDPMIAVSAFREYEGAMERAAAAEAESKTSTMNMYVFDGDWALEVIAAHSEEEAWDFLSGHSGTSGRPESVEQMREQWKIKQVFDPAAMTEPSCIAHYSG